MLPTIKTAPKAQLSDYTVLLYGQSKAGKCLAGSTLLYDSNTGRPIRLDDFVSEAKASVFTMQQAGVISLVTPSAYICNEPAQLYRLTTQTGRNIEATANHPFLTRDGWKELHELKMSDRVAVVAEYPEFFGHTHTDDNLLKVLAYLIADGNIGGGSPIFCKEDPEVRMDFESAVEALGDECIEYVNAKGVMHVRVRGRTARKTSVLSELKRLELSGLRSAEKFIPDCVFGLNKRKLRTFLRCLFSCDGSVESAGKISYSSTSIRMVHQIQHLLLRFGIVSLIRSKFLNGELYGAELMISSKGNVLKFIDYIGFIGDKSARAETVRSALYNIRGAETQLDRHGAILFDRIVNIEPTTIEPVYDLTIDETHNFVANDFIVHNSTFCANSESALFLATEPGLNALEVFQVSITKWEDMLQACAEIADGKHQFKTIIIDTIDNAYKMCADYMCKKSGVDHESDLGYGKGYALINNEFQRVLNKLAFLPYGLILISHAQTKEVDTRTGKIMRTVPTLPDKARKIVVGLVDMILYCDLETVKGEDGKSTMQRVLRTKPHLSYDAGDRTGRLPEVLPMNYSAFVEAFEKAAPTAAPTSAPAAAPASTAKLTNTAKKDA